MQNVYECCFRMLKVKKTAPLLVDYIDNVKRDGVFHPLEILVHY